MSILPRIEFASLGMWDSLILLLMALVVFGPRRMPEIGRQIGKLMLELRKASNEFKFQMEEELRTAGEADRRRAEEARLRELPVLSTAQAAQTLKAGSQPPEANPEAPAATSESPFPNESGSPELTAPTETSVEEQIRILPPTAGESVAAAQPDRMATQAAENPVAEGGRADHAQTPTGKITPETEQTAHND